MNKLMDIPDSTVRNIITDQKENVCIEAYKKRKRPVRDDEILGRHIENLVDEEPFQTFGEYLEILNNGGAKTSRSTLIKMINDQGFHSFFAAHVPLLSDTNRQKRVNWCNEHLEWAIHQSKLIGERSAIIEKYLKSTSKPTFNHFSATNEQAIETLSVSLLNNNAIGIQRHWVKLYNDSVAHYRPGRPLVGKVVKTSERFKNIHEIVKQKRKLKHTLRLASLVQTRSQARTAQLIAQTQEEHETEEEEDETEEQDVEESEEEDAEESEEDSQATCELVDIIKKAGEPLPSKETVVHKEFKKLMESSCINLLHESFSSLYRRAIPAPCYKRIMDACTQNKAEFETLCSEEMEKIITMVFDNIKKYQYDENIINLLGYLDTEKAKITNKSSDPYLILCIIDEVIKSFKAYTNESKVSECTYLRKFAQILDQLLLTTTMIAIYDGETVSNATRRMLIAKGEEVDYGRRIDLIVKTKGDAQYELAANEFKRSDVSNDIMKYQQSKNVRINTCIKNEIDLLLKNYDTRINYFDFEGRHAYISQLFSFEGCYIAYKVGSFTIPKNLIQLDGFRSSLINLYAWKNATIKNSQNVVTAISNEEAAYGLVDIADDLPPPLCLSPPRKPQIIPAKVYLSPSKSSKRR